MHISDSSLILLQFLNLLLFDSSRFLPRKFQPRIVYLGIYLDPCVPLANVHKVQQILQHLHTQRFNSQGFGYFNVFYLRVVFWRMVLKEFYLSEFFGLFELVEFLVTTRDGWSFGQGSALYSLHDLTHWFRSTPTQQVLGQRRNHN